MKNTIKFLTILAIVFTLNSCDEAKELANVNFDTTLTEEFLIHIGENQDYISQEQVLSLDNTDTHDYLDKLKSVEFKKLTYKFKDFSGNESCTMNVEISFDGTLFDTQQFDVKQAVDNQTIYEITDVNTLNSIATALKNNKQVSFKMEGEVFNGEAEFTTELTAEIAIVANPL